MTEEPLRVWLDDKAEVFCLVDAEDYDWAIQWRWSFTWDKRRKKKYATRSTRRRKERDTQVKIYMHKAILAERKKAVPPSELHTIGDHEDGDSLNNTRGNLRFFTPSQNRRTARR